MNRQSITAALQTLGGTILILVIGLAWLFCISRIWPLPRQQGLTYVAHPTMALGGSVLAAIVFLVMSLITPTKRPRWLLISAGISTLLITLVWAAR